MFGKKKKQIAELQEKARAWQDAAERIEAQHDEARRDAAVLLERLETANKKLKEFGHPGNF